jgi:hypothetical protein
MSKDKAYQSRPGDVFDMSDAMSIPYIECATLDRAMSHFFSIASSGLNRGRTKPLPLRTSFQEPEGTLGRAQVNDKRPCVD